MFIWFWLLKGCLGLGSEQGSVGCSFILSYCSAEPQQHSSDVVFHSVAKIDTLHRRNFENR
jgi:hypothetical protein